MTFLDWKVVLHLVPHHPEALRRLHGQTNNDLALLHSVPRSNPHISFQTPEPSAAPILNEPRYHFPGATPEVPVTPIHNEPMPNGSITLMRAVDRKGLVHVRPPYHLIHDTVSLNYGISSILKLMGYQSEG